MLDETALVPVPLPVGVPLTHLRPIGHKGIDSGATEANQTANTGIVHNTVHCAMHPPIQRYSHCGDVFAFAGPDGLVVVQFRLYSWLPYHLAADAEVTFRIYNIQGQLVRQLDLGAQAAGSYQDKESALYWDGRDQFGETVSSGIYFYRLNAGDFQATKRMVIVK